MKPWAKRVYADARYCYRDACSCLKVDNRSFNTGTAGEFLVVKLVGNFDHLGLVCLCTPKVQKLDSFLLEVIQVRCCESLTIDLLQDFLLLPEAGKLKPG
ncbi:hypothetical protein NE237_011839 [Protea cynaroides]|uniref:Uncharacterized protein n=1 Tax=Protea cynaroides TaxID=273540 RepID=A0A9Q0GVN7_9MAGN|nr:hypothetical protein NE237_011839 [Protea cynaroides]